MLRMAEDPYGQYDQQAFKTICCISFAGRTVLQILTPAPSIIF